MIPGVADIVHPTNLGSASGPVVPDGDDPAIPMVPRDAYGPPDDVPVIREEVGPVIPDPVAPMGDGDPDEVAPKIPCEDAFEIPALAILVPVIPGDADPWSG